MPAPISTNPNSTEIDQILEPEHENMKLIIKITKMKNVNVFAYEGSSRYNATVSIIPDNERMVLGQNATVPYDSGILLVVYPDKGVETEFAFEYYRDIYEWVNWTKIIEIE